MGEDAPAGGAAGSGMRRNMATQTGGAIVTREGVTSQLKEVLQLVAMLVLSLAAAAGVALAAEASAAAMPAVKAFSLAHGHLVAGALLTAAVLLYSLSPVQDFLTRRLLVGGVRKSGTKLE